VAFRIRETRGIDPRRVERVISMRVLVCPGVEIHGDFSAAELRLDSDRVVCVRPGRKLTYAPGLQLHQMQEVMQRVAQQAREWRAFAVLERPRRGHREAFRYDYRFEIQLIESAEKYPVLEAAPSGSGDLVDDTRRPGRRHASVNDAQSFTGAQGLTPKGTHAPSRGPSGHGRDAPAIACDGRSVDGPPRRGPTARETLLPTVLEKPTLKRHKRLPVEACESFSLHGPLARLRVRASRSRTRSGLSAAAPPTSCSEPASFGPSSRGSSPASQGVRAVSSEA
jgi:hypothetical protein